MRASGLIQRLQALRFFAAALVLVGHVVMEVMQHPGMLSGFLDNTGGAWVFPVLRSIPWGGGVDLFFVISGFIISYGSLSKGPSWQNSLDFIVRRLIRIWPIYVIFTLLMLLATLVFRNAISHPNIDFTHIISSLLFIPWPRPDDGRMFPVLGQGWTLNYEMFFYLCFAVVILFPIKLRVLSLCAGSVFLVSAGIYFDLNKIVNFYANPIIFEFILGVLIGHLFKNSLFFPKLSLFSIALGLFLMLFSYRFAPDLNRVIGAGLPAALIVGGVLWWGEAGEKILGRRSLVMLGNSSYALYLSHSFVINLILLVWLKMKIGWPLLFFAVAILASIVGSVFVYIVMERPLLKYFGNYYANHLRVREPANVAKSASP